MKTLTKSRRGRPSDTVHGSLRGGNPQTGEYVAWSDGQWTGSGTFLKEKDYLVEVGEALPVPGIDADVFADAGTPVAVYAIIAELVGPNGRIKGDIPVDEVARLAAFASLDPDDLDGDA